MSVDDLASLEETLEILSDPTLTREIRASRREIEKGAAQRLTKDEALALRRR